MLSTNNETFRCGSAEKDVEIPTKDPVLEDGKVKCRCSGCSSGCMVSVYGMVSEETYIELLSKLENK